MDVRSCDNTGAMQQKYRTRNPVSRALVGGFFRAAESLLDGMEAGRLLDVGCGEGFAGDRLRSAARPRQMIGLDLSPSELARASTAYSYVSFVSGSAYQLPFPTARFDLVIVLEVLEHLERPDDALAEIQRVANSAVLVSVPWEPVWRTLNVLRGAYVTSLGNTPGHLQHWSRSGFLRLLRRRFHVVEVRTPLPWTMALCSV